VIDINAMMTVRKTRKDNPNQQRDQKGENNSKDDRERLIHAHRITQPSPKGRKFFSGGPTYVFCVLGCSAQGIFREVDRMRGQLRQEATQPYYAFPVSMVWVVGLIRLDD
jgi:hypothetical protein